ncbi:MBL fold metallo-hydrolase [Terrabacter sp. NPDC080008]|uniref:MBL fold metallo-hydrolase n=1 Tax=Terrabacter sp. NPDC080008 TaxID=3155176 RepID=UPI00344DB289
MTERAECVLCPNPSPMTLDGTNTWLLAEPGSDEVVVVDPGPLDEAHLQHVVRRVSESGRRVALTLLTHGHADHAEGVGRFAELTGAPVRGFGRGHDDLRAGETVRVGGLEILAAPTPGHTSDSFSFVLPADNTLLTGDTVLGRGTTVVAWPDGSLEAYLASLEHIEALTRAGEVTSLLPGHGPFVADAAATVTFYLKHRAERLEQVREAVARGAQTAYDVVEQVYADVPRSVWPAAELSVRAQLDYLRAHA